MKKMKNMTKQFMYSLGLLSLSCGKALAAGDGFYTTQPSAPPTAVSQDTFGNSVTTLINYFLGILGLIAVAFLIYAGILMVTAGGNDEQVGKAKGIITYAVVGIIIIILSWTIVQFVTRALG